MQLGNCNIQYKNTFYTTKYYLMYIKNREELPIEYSIFGYTHEKKWTFSLCRQTDCASNEANMIRVKGILYAKNHAAKR
jgi:hypothetical protein